MIKVAQIMCTTCEKIKQHISSTILIVLKTYLFHNDFIGYLKIAQYSIHEIVYRVCVCAGCARVDAVQIGFAFGRSFATQICKEFMANEPFQMKKKNEINVLPHNVSSLSGMFRVNKKKSKSQGTYSERNKVSFFIILYPE